MKKACNPFALLVYTLLVEIGNIAKMTSFSPHFSNKTTAVEREWPPLSLTSLPHLIKQ